MPPPPLPLPPQQSRINLSDLKSQIVKRLGPERSQRYFQHLNRLLSQKLSKPEFNKLCLSTLGRENVALHNQLIRSILRNAYHSKVGPPVAHNRNLAKAVNDGGSNLSTAPLPPVLSNGDILPPSPRKSRSGIRRIKDRPSPLGPNGRVDASTNQPFVTSDEFVARDNGELSPYSLKRSVQHYQGWNAEQPAKKQRTEKPSLHDQVLLHNENLVESVAVGEREDLELRHVLQSMKGPLQAPLGIPFCPASVGGARRSLPLNISGNAVSGITSYDSGELCNSEDLRTRMEKIAQIQGLGGVTIECANLLNNGLDAYLKQIIKSSIKLVRARRGHDLLMQPLYKQQSLGKAINGVWPGNHMHVQSSGGPLEATHKEKSHCPFCRNTITRKRDSPTAMFYKWMEKHMAEKVNAACVLRLG
ncbi:hypothetical protein J5N97_026761 [Dioscorea zingiberensis]|uniref:Transcriptional coactivator Hfi1/Transcriptional adapter 1 n=1 Tax=Dioscorea zingiberensis TaxID=325984 RepID=A0A9D5C3Q8_9LILI|nr:hypothetical protein J5N97_026761 [Dioscorea zingiberensis]